MTQVEEIRKNQIINNIDNRHKEANRITQDVLDNIFAPVPESKDSFEALQADLESLL